MMKGEVRGGRSEPDLPATGSRAFWGKGRMNMRERRYEPYWHSGTPGAPTRPTRGAGCAKHQVPSVRLGRTKERQLAANWWGEAK